MRTLDPTDRQLLARLEAAIDRGLAGTNEAFEALLEIQQKQLYLASHDDFWEYVDSRWPTSKRHIYRLLARERVVENVSAADRSDPLGHKAPVPNERQARELARLPANDQPPVWEAVCAMAKATRKRVTAAALREAVDQFLSAEEEADAEAVAGAAAERQRRASAEVDREAVEAWAGALGRANRRLRRRFGERAAEGLRLVEEGAALVRALVAG